jgi:exosome complex RNA-binding protein Rrp42 (RNase PH superfamily)
MEQPDNVLKMLDPIAHMDAYVQEGVRYDGRLLASAREMTVTDAPGCNEGTSIGGAVVCLRPHILLPATTSVSNPALRAGSVGGTSCTCHVSVQIGRPSLDQPNEGDISFEVVLPAAANPVRYNTEQRKRHDDAVDLETLLHAVFCPGAGAPAVLDLTQLCLQSGVAAYRLVCSLHFTSIDGNLQDCAVAAVWHALHRTSLPRLADNANTGAAVPLVRRDGSVPLVLRKRVIATTFAVWSRLVGGTSGDADEGRESLLADPTAEEEGLTRTTVTLVRALSTADASRAAPSEGGGGGGVEMRGMFFNALGNVGSQRRGPAMHVPVGFDSARLCALLGVSV